MLHLWIVRRLSQESNMESSETIYFVCKNNSLCKRIKYVQKIFEMHIASGCLYTCDDQSFVWMTKGCCELWHYALLYLSVLELRSSLCRFLLVLWYVCWTQRYHLCSLSLSLIRVPSSAVHYAQTILLTQWDQKVASRTEISKGSRCAVCMTFVTDLLREKNIISFLKKYKL